MDPEPASLSISFLTIDFSVVFGFALLFFLLACSAMVSGAEVALFSLTRSEVEEQLGLKSKRMQLVAKLLERPKKLLATILIANNFINIATVILFDSLADILFGRLTSELLRFFVEVGLVTFLILLFGEILPKIYVPMIAAQT